MLFESTYCVYVRVKCTCMKLYIKIPNQKSTTSLITQHSPIYSLAHLVHMLPSSSSVHVKQKLRAGHEAVC